MYCPKPMDPRGIDPVRRHHNLRSHRLSCSRRPANRVCHLCQLTPLGRTPFAGYALPMTDAPTDLVQLSLSIRQDQVPPGGWRHLASERVQVRLPSNPRRCKQIAEVCWAHGLKSRAITPPTHLPSRVRYGSIDLSWCKSESVGKSISPCSSIEIPVSVKLSCRTPPPPCGAGTAPPAPVAYRRDTRSTADYGPEWPLPPTVRCSTKWCMRAGTSASRKTCVCAGM